MFVCEATYSVIVSCENGMEHRDTEAQSFIFRENRVHEGKNRLYDFYFLSIYTFRSIDLCILRME